MWLYVGLQNPTRTHSDRLTTEKLVCRVQVLCRERDGEAYSQKLPQDLFHVNNPPSEVRFFPFLDILSSR